jgi:GxxExxY protein
VGVIYREESYAIMGACFEVYKEKGCGFLEGVYQECLAFEFALQQIPFSPHFPTALSYKGQSFNKSTYPISFALTKSFWKLRQLQN